MKTTAPRLLTGLLYAFVAVVLGVTIVLAFFSWQASVRETKTRAEAAPATGRFVQVGDVELFIQELGLKDGPAVLLIHGAGAWGGIWQETMAALAQAGYYCIAVDVPPFGFSERPNPPAYSRLDQARRFSALIEALSLSSVTLVSRRFCSARFWPPSPCAMPCWPPPPPTRRSPSRFCR